MTRLCGFITGAWYPVLTSHRLARGALRPITVANQPVLLARRPSGEAFAIRDACPHRGIPLSRGALVGNEIECGYHGWRFDGEGCCRAIPSLLDDQQLKLESIRVPCYPLRDLHGLLWLYVPDAGLPERNSAGEPGERFINSSGDCPEHP